MKILYKMFLGFTVVILSIWVVEIFAVDTSKKALKKSIEESSLLLAVQIIDELDKNIFRRIEENQLYSKDLILQKTVLESNREFEKLDDIQAYINKKDREWTSAPKESITPLMQKIINNELSNELKERGNYFKDKYGYDVFSEFIVTNKYGANVALTGKATDYGQDDEEWWQTAKNERFYISDIGYDKSADVYSIRDLEFLGKVSDEFLSHFKKDRTGSFIAEAITKEKGEKLFSYARSNFRGLDWILILEHETKEIFAPINELRNGILIISLAITIFAILTSFLFSSSITKPITKLRDAAIRIGKGNLDTRIDVTSKDEIGQMASSFNKMSEDLKETTTSIEYLNKEKAERKRADDEIG